MIAIKDVYLLLKGQTLWLIPHLINKNGLFLISTLIFLLISPFGVERSNLTREWETIFCLKSTFRHNCHSWHYRPPVLLVIRITIAILNFRILISRLRISFFKYRNHLLRMYSICILHHLINFLIDIKRVQSILQNLPLNVIILLQFFPYLLKAR